MSYLWIPSGILLGFAALLLAATIISFAFRERVARFGVGGKRVVITGGSSGIGLACAVQMAREGAASICIVARDQGRLDEALPLIRAANGATVVTGISADVSDKAAVQAACEEAVKVMGGVDCVICSAGASNPSLFIATDEDEFEWLMKVNYTGTVYVLKALVPHLIRSGGGRIVLVGSMAGLSGVAGFTAYSASKFALRGLAESLHMELCGPYGIGVSLVSPPDVNTPMLERENLRKPRECRIISEGSGMFEAEDIAADVVSAIKNWRFLVNTGMDGKFLALIATGTSPAHSGLVGVLEFASVGLLRVVSLVYRWHYNRIVARVHKERLAGALDDAAAKAHKAIVAQE